MPTEIAAVVVPPEAGDARGRVWRTEPIPRGGGRTRKVLAARVGDVISVDLARTLGIEVPGDAEGTFLPEPLDLRIESTARLTVKEVLDLVGANRDLAADALKAETGGKGRKSLVSALEALLEAPEAETAPETSEVLLEAPGVGSEDLEGATVDLEGS